MRLSEFMKREADAIVEEWAEFARTCIPVARDLSEVELRDHAKLMLQRMADDMEQPQSDGDKHQKSRGNQPGNAPELTEAARADAEQRLRQGFSHSVHLTAHPQARKPGSRKSGIQRAIWPGKPPTFLVGVPRVATFRESDVRCLPHKTDRSIASGQLLACFG
ncbi:MAG: RsbRD N-terminal domain-containing protein [Burkholderiaceae bacterium]